MFWFKERSIAVLYYIYNIYIDLFYQGLDFNWWRLADGGMQSDAAGGTAAMRCETNLRLFLLVFRGAAGFFKSAAVAV